MIWPWVVGGIVGYIIIGAVSAGILSALGYIDSEDPDETIPTIVFWPVFFSMGLAESITTRIKDSVKRKIDE